MMNNPINILIHGYGKVGHFVQQYAHPDPDLSILGTVSRDDPQATYQSIEEVELKEVDIIVDFSSGDAFIQLFQYVSENNPQVRIVTGVSDWSNEEERIKSEVLKKKMYLLYGPNFSIGTALFMKVVNYATKLFDNFETFDVSLLDIHHRHKTDMPSNTAKKIANEILNNSRTKNSILYGMRNNKIQDNELHVNCLRVGENKGFHEVMFDAPDEIIKISQQTRDRGTYALGALLSAKWLMKQKKYGFYTFNSYLAELIT